MTKVIDVKKLVEVLPKGMYEKDYPMKDKKELKGYNFYRVKLYESDLPEASEVVEVDIGRMALAIRKKITAMGFTTTWEHECQLAEAISQSKDILKWKGKEANGQVKA